jgi:hypothetical protein
VSEEAKRIEDEQWVLSVGYEDNDGNAWWNVETQDGTLVAGHLTHDDAEFIASARQDMPQLRKRVEELESQMERAREQIHSDGRLISRLHKENKELQQLLWSATGDD